MGLGGSLLSICLQDETLSRSSRAHTFVSFCRDRLNISLPLDLAVRILPHVPAEPSRPEYFFRGRELFTYTRNAGLSSSDQAVLWSAFHELYPQFSHRRLSVLNEDTGIEDEIKRRLALEQDHVRILDIACGPRARGMVELAEKYGPAVHAVGIDIAAKERSPAVSLCRADAFHLPFKAGSFDLVHTEGFLFYLTRQELAQVLGETRRVLAPGGLLLSDEHYARLEGCRRELSP